MALRARTVAEMQEKLGQRFGKETADRTVERLQSEGLLNDAEFARQWRDSRERKKPRSPHMIEQELKQRGVGQEAISEALEGFDSLAAAYRAASRYAARQEVHHRAAFDRRVGMFLSRRGFEPAVVRQTLHQLRAELNISGHKESEAEYTEE